MFGPIVSSYSRAQAIADGALFPVCTLDTMSGPVPVCFTRGLAGAIASGGFPSLSQGSRATLRAMAQASAALTVASDSVRFDVPAPAGPIQAWALCGPDDSGNPAVTVMLQSED